MAQLLEFAREHRLRMISVADLIAYRQQRERLVLRVGEFRVLTEVGPAHVIAYATPFDSVHHLALIIGDLGDGVDVPVRIHREHAINDVFARRDGQPASLIPANLIPKALQGLGAKGRGVLIYLREGAAGVAASTPGAEAAAGMEAAAEVAGAGTERARAQQWREVGIGAQILRDLGVASIRLLATRHRHYVGLSGFGIDITATELIDG
jgi:3,4-dihydroxy 2-butanone 4-phosphate synthase/GTP cyclohydrolase II